MALSRFVVPLKDWGDTDNDPRDNPGRTLIQGLRIHKPSGTRIVHQADDVAGQREQDVILRAHTAQNRYLGAATIKRCGHGSTVGLESTGPDTMRIWLGHEQQNGSGYVNYKVGQTGTLSFIKAAGLPKGDVSVDQDDDLLCIRTGGRYRGYRLSTCLSGKPKLLWDFTIPAWGKRFQGHLVFRGRLFVHRDVETKGASRAHVFDYAGKPVSVAEGGANWIDTTRMGDEAEGFEAIDGTVCVVKRTGNTGPGRVVEVTPWLEVPDPKGGDMAEKIRFRDGWTCICVVTVFPLIEREMIARGYIKQSIDVWQWGYRTDVKDSAFTHAGGGVLDTDQCSDPELKVWREWGFEMQRRTKAQGFNLEHGHGVLKGCPHVSRGTSGAAWQLSEWEAGRNGLRGRGPITGPEPKGRNTPTWQRATADHKANAAKTLDQWTRELGELRDVSVLAINSARGSGNASRHVAVMQRWLTLACHPVAVDGRWSAHGETQDALNAFRLSLGWTGKDVIGSAGVSSLSKLRAVPAVAASKPLPIREAKS